MKLTTSLLVDTAAATAGPKSESQLRREGTRAAEWFAANGGLDAHAMTANRVAFLDAFAPELTHQGQAKRTHWNWVVGKLTEAAELLANRPRYATQAAARTRAIDDVVPNSALDAALQHLQKDASSKARWGVLRCDIALWLTFLREVGVDPADADLVQIEQFRDWLDAVQPNGKPRRKQSKSVIVPARQLTALLKLASA
jgi:hypothetical protein